MVTSRSRSAVCLRGFGVNAIGTLVASLFEMHERVIVGVIAFVDCV